MIPIDHVVSIVRTWKYQSCSFKECPYSSEKLSAQCSEQNFAKES